MGHSDGRFAACESRAARSPGIQPRRRAAQSPPDSMRASAPPRESTGAVVLFPAVNSGKRLIVERLSDMLSYGSVVALRSAGPPRHPTFNITR